VTSIAAETGSKRGNSFFSGQSRPNTRKSRHNSVQTPPYAWDRCYEFKNIFAEKLAFSTQNKAKVCNFFIITLDFEKNANFFTVNWQKSQKIVIITSAPDRFCIWNRKTMCSPILLCQNYVVHNFTVLNSSPQIGLLL
jgi:hypothetical protein